MSSSDPNAQEGETLLRVYLKSEPDGRVRVRAVRSDGRETRTALLDAQFLANLGLQLPERIN